jgi:hypothetical protein
MATVCMVHLGSFSIEELSEKRSTYEHGTFSNWLDAEV